MDRSRLFQWVGFRLNCWSLLCKSWFFFLTQHCYSFSKCTYPSTLQPYWLWLCETLGLVINCLYPAVSFCPSKSRRPHPPTALLVLSDVHQEYSASEWEVVWRMGDNKPCSRLTQQKYLPVDNTTVVTQHHPFISYAKGCFFFAAFFFLTAPSVTSVPSPSGGR